MTTPPSPRPALRRWAVVALHACICALAALPTLPAAPDMRIAIRDNQLHVQILEQTQDRAFHTLYGLLGLLHHHRVPDVYTTFTTVKGDDIAPSDERAPHFAYWRPPGAAGPALWPDWDFWGWTEPWVAPLPLFERQMSLEMTPWAQRSGRVYWKGTPWKTRQRDTRPAPRRTFMACAAADPGLFAAVEIHFRVLLADQGDVMPPMQRRWVKPVSLDQRQLMDHKFLIYLPGRTWSTSLKRLLFAGAVVVLPANNPHDFVVTEKLSACEGCFLTYDLDDMCASLKRALAATSDADARAMAERLAAFARREFALEAMELYMLDALRRAAGEEGGVAAPPGSNLTRVDCAWVKRQHKALVGEHVSWQIDEWFDDECLVRNATYLRYVAL